MSFVALLALGAAGGVLSDAGIELSGTFSEVELEGFVAGLEALPPRLRAVPGGTLRLVLDESLPPSASGISVPEWRTPTSFILTRQEGFETFRDEALDAPQRRKLWRARALVHAVLSRWDAVERWSLDPRWRRANGWLLPFERPLTLGERALNHARTAFARARGQRSAQLDFLTFAEAFFVRVDEPLPRDDRLECQDFTRSRALSALLGLEWKTPGCPGFDGWHRAGELDHLEVLLVQSSGRAPESLFGHLLVRPVWRTSLGPSFDTAIQFAAITPPRPDALHLVRGLFGGYSIGVFTISVTDLEREKLSGEQRSMTRWKLAMSADEQRRFLERAWEFERRGRFDYAFFSDNCATLLVWMLESALEEPALVRWPGFITSPAGVLDDFFRAQRRSGERLLQPLLPAMEATGVVARRADARRRELERELKADFSDVHSEDVPTRAAAYVALAGLTRRAPGSEHRAWARWWSLSARVERAPADVALHERRELELTLVEGGPLDLDAMWDDRLRKLERESQLQQQLMMLDRDSFLDDLRRRQQRRALTPKESEALAEHTAQLALFEQVTDAQGALLDEVLGEFRGDRFIDDELHAAVVTETIASTRSLPVSGHWRASVAAGVWARRGDLSAVVRVEEAGLLELLGEQRLRGMGAPVGVRMLEGGVTFEPERLRFVQSHFTLISFDSIAAPLPPAAPWKEHVGFGFELSSDFREWRSMPSLNGFAGWVMLHARDAHARNFVALGVGPAGWVGSDGVATVTPLGGGTARLVGRLALSRTLPSALRLEVRHQSVWGLGGRVLHELRADASLEVVLAWGGAPKVLVRPTVALTAEPTLGRTNVLALVALEPAESLRDLFTPR